MLNLIKEVRYAYQFAYKTPKADKLIVFYAEHEGYYPCFEDLLHKLIDNYNYTVCYITSKANDPILQNTNPNIRTFYFDKLLPLFMAFIDCKVFIMTLTDLGNFHLKRSANKVQYVYVFHALVSTHMMYRRNAFNHYDHIFCGGQHHTYEIRKHEELYNLPPKQLVEVGYSRLEQVYNEYQEYQKIDPQKTILIAPSWGTRNILESCGEQLVELLLGERYRVIVRPHPETVRHSSGLIKHLDAKFKDNPDFTLEWSVATNDSLLCADVLISEYSGVALEYALGTERPVLFLDTPIKVKNDKYEELGIEPLELTLRSKIGIVVSLDRLSTIPAVIDKLMLDSAQYKEKLAALRTQCVYNFGHAAKVGAKYIDAIVRTDC